MTKRNFISYGVHNPEYGTSHVLVCTDHAENFVVDRVQHSVPRRHPNTRWELKQVTPCNEKEDHRHFYFEYEVPL